MALSTRPDLTTDPPCRVCGSGAVVSGACSTCGHGASYAAARRRPAVARLPRTRQARPPAPRNHAHRWDAGIIKYVFMERKRLFHCTRRGCRATSYEALD